MITPEPFKWKCPKCGYSKIINPEGDSLHPEVFNNQCPKCNASMETTSLNILERLFIARKGL